MINQIQIDATTEQAVENFAQWFKKEGFDLFIKSKFNKLKPNNTDNFISCLATDEKMEWGYYFQIE
jgi:hypothetical protein